MMQMTSFWAVLAAVVVLAVSLVIDGLSVSMSIGARMHGALRVADYGKSAAWFTGMHVAMLSAGFLLGDTLAAFVEGVGPWISFTLLALVGGTMVRSALKKSSEDEQLNSMPPLTWKSLAALSFACSIDAIAVGSSLGLSGSLPFGLTVSVVAVATVLAIVLGLRMGSAAGEKWEKPAEIAGGVVLLLIGIKSLL
ncbi:hypothetical protein B9G54_01050 [Alloscardovia macacae]|uniref:Manganese efflux pump MntP n=1 Tax=Alloscardovia macacae TaxID=1160091 RepID=A0A1Y2SZ93_9BIFI|nr:manganese efflux pump [Alloscardovia macacae]OTA27413.1 hypothetical protein B9G54_01050 [Alloscardovia macacae]OTA29425.1 hypothetical protein B9T39_03485 [Alloscardovia macacae]